jgi:transketolase
LALSRNGPTYIRVCRNATPVLFEAAPALELGRIRKLRDGGDVTIVVCGVPTYMALEAAGRLQSAGIGADLLEASTIKPVDEAVLVESAAKTGRVLTVEEHSVIGGLGSAVAEVLGRRAPAKMDFIGLADCFAESGPYLDLLSKFGISTEAIESRARQLLMGQAA